MKNGDVKSTLILTLRDDKSQIDVTFWEHLDVIKMIHEEQLAMTLIALQGVAVNENQGANTLNMGEDTIVTINPEGEIAENLKNISSEDDNFNLPQRSSVCVCIDTSDS